MINLQCECAYSSPMNATMNIMFSGANPILIHHSARNKRSGKNAPIMSFITKISIFCKTASPSPLQLFTYTAYLLSYVYFKGLRNPNQIFSLLLRSTKKVRSKQWKNLGLKGTSGFKITDPGPECAQPNGKMTAFLNCFCQPHTRPVFRVVLHGPGPECG